MQELSPETLVSVCGGADDFSKFLEQKLSAWDACAKRTTAGLADGEDVQAAVDRNCMHLLRGPTRRR